MENNYIYDDKNTQSNSFHYKRTKNEPLDWSDLFATLTDAQEYARGVYKKEGEARPKAHDIRGLAGASYPGQTITVFENGRIVDYKIQEDRTLKPLVDVIDCGTF